MTVQLGCSSQLGNYSILKKQFGGWLSKVTLGRKNYEIDFCHLLGLLKMHTDKNSYLIHADQSTVLGCCLSPWLLQCVRLLRGWLEEKVTNSSNFYFCICHIAEERHIVHLIKKRWADLPIYSFYFLDGHDYMTHFGINILMQTGIIYWWSLLELIFSRFKSSLEVKYSVWLRLGINSLDIFQPLQM